MIGRKPKFATAEEWLAHLRELPEDYASSILWIEGTIQKENKTLEEIGTTADELRSLRLAAVKKRASSLLGRDGHDLNTARPASVLVLAIKENLPLSELGTNEQELKSVMATIAKNEALDRLNVLRSIVSIGAYDDLDRIRVIGEIVSPMLHGGWTLADIGSSETELRELYQK